VTVSRWSGPASPDDVFALVSRVTRLLLAGSYEGTVSCESIVRRVAASYGYEVRASFLADTAVVTMGPRTLSFSAEPGVPRLDQVSRMKRILAEIESGAVSPAGALRLLDEASARPPPWSKPWQVLGLTLFAVGFGISVQATWQQVAVSGVTGSLVGLLVVAGVGRDRLALLSPLLGSVVVSVIVLEAYQHGWIDGGPIQLLVPALFYFIPGDALSAATLELVDGRITAGASRLVYSMVMLLVLAFGTLVATVIAGVPVSFLFDVDVPGNLPAWAVWAGWVLFAVGVMLTFGMATRDFPWALLLVLLTAATVELAARAVGDPVATFVGAVVMTVAAQWLGRLPSLPPAYVLYLGAFYVLTPGSHGLRGLESWIGGNEVKGVTDLTGMIGLLTAIALGMLVGAALATVRGRRLQPRRQEDLSSI
jgi:uncharacterized membrane protein YjjP (DUF1212 family)